jgi:N6-adenosine-specific RNA methylase IME4
MTLEFHPLANLFPLIEGEAFAALVEDVRANGIHEEIVMLDGKILDGRNRYRAGVAAGILAEDHDWAGDWGFITFSEKDLSAEIFERGPLAYVLSKNLHRRHLDESQRAMIAARLATMRQGEREQAGTSQAEAAEALKVSPRLLRSAKTVQDKAEPALARAVDRGDIAVSAAAQAATLAPYLQLKVVEAAEAGQGNAVRSVLKKEMRSAKEAALGAKQMALPDKRYGVIYADPEWRFEPWSRDSGMDRAPENHYPTTKTIDIMARPVGDIAAEDCVLFLWATSAMLPHALMVMTAWGFDYKTHAIWNKVRKGEQGGTGYWFTGEHELLLLGTRGQVPAPAPGTQWKSVIFADAGKHSEKPEIFAKLIEHYFPTLPRIELNARRAREGWDSWGNEAPNEHEIPKPATEAAAVGEVESSGGTEEFIDDTFHFVDAGVGVMTGAGSGHGNAIGSGVTGGESAATFDLGDGLPHFLRRISA